MVHIEFRDAPSQDRDLNRALAERFGIGRCVVAATDDPAAVARLGADVVDALLDPGETIGIAWGSTVARVVRAMQPRNDPTIDVIQLAGSSTALDSSADPGDLTRILAERLGGRPHRIHAPAFVESAELRSALERQPEVAATLERFETVGIAVVGIGAFGASDHGASSSLIRSGALTAAELDRLRSWRPTSPRGPSRSRSSSFAAFRPWWRWQPARPRSRPCGARWPPASSGSS